MQNYNQVYQTGIQLLKEYNADMHKYDPLCLNLKYNLLNLYVDLINFYGDPPYLNAANIKKNATLVVNCIYAMRNSHLGH